jgi:hypothetical protein
LEALTKEKKEKDNVLTYLELMNLNSASLHNSKKLGKKKIEAKKKKLV